MHQTETCQDFEAMDVQLQSGVCEKSSLCERVEAYPRVHEDEIHLHEGENHLQQRVNTAQDLVTR